MKILFIGNSYTYFNDMPQLLQQLLQENGFDAHVDSVTKGGRKLFENLQQNDENSEKITELCENNLYDVLFLQEQSYLPAVNYEVFEDGARRLKEKVLARNTILYATWGRKEGCPLLTDKGWTNPSMTELLRDAYHRVGAQIGARVSDVGLCFARVRELEPELELYNPDLSHPSYSGSCVAAVCHYKMLTGALPKTTACLKTEGIDSILRAADEIIG